MIGGFGPCGRELCCSSFLKDFEPVSIRMAKRQDLVLNPAKISGICGRLMCCLGYEYTFYDEAKKEARRKLKDAAPEKAPEKAAQEPVKAREADVKAEGDKSDKTKRKRNAWRKRKKKGKEGGGPEGAPKPPAAE
jgi:hypothetical protein